MDANQILTADVLDIVFDGRNKQYGAYELRKNYGHRLGKSLLVTGVVVGLAFGVYRWANAGTSPVRNRVQVDPMELQKLEEAKKKEVIPPEVKKPDPPKVEMKQYTKFLLVQNPPPEEIPPEVQDLDKAKIGKINVEGNPDENLVTPPVDDRKGIVDIPAKGDDDNTIFRSVEIESDYPGGASAWRMYLNKNLQYPSEAQEQEIQGSVMVQFIVDKEGVVSEVSAVSGPKELQGEAIRVIKKSGNWTSAIQNGRKVKSYKRQLITFKISE